MNGFYDILTFCSIILISGGIGFGFGVLHARKILNSMLAQEFGVSKEDVEKLQKEFES